jgi:alpha-beta hydrolase superfamily lysophospholipase
LIVVSASRYYESEHMRYLHEAEHRMGEVAALPGPLFTVGLSMGGAIALSLAALHPDKIAKTAVFAPLLKVVIQTTLKLSEYSSIAHTKLSLTITRMRPKCRANLIFETDSYC